MSGRGLVAVVVAVGLVVTGVAVWTVRVARTLDQASAEAADVSAYLAQMSTELRSTRADAELLVDLLAVLDDDPLRQVDLRGEPGRGTARMLAGREGFILLVRGLPEPRAGRSYEIWIEAAVGAATSAGTFDVNPFGRATVVKAVAVPADARVQVTEEPSEGSPGPTSGPVLNGLLR